MTPYSILLFIIVLVIGIIIFIRNVGDNITTAFIMIIYAVLGAGFVRFYYEIKN